MPVRQLIGGHTLLGVACDYLSNFIATKISSLVLVYFVDSLCVIRQLICIDSLSGANSLCFVIRAFRAIFVVSALVLDGTG
jgi:hypothetical protein